MICPNCSHSHSFKIKTCPNCGILQPSVVTVNQVLPKFQNKWKPTIFLLPVVILSLTYDAGYQALGMLWTLRDVFMPYFTAINNELLVKEIFFGIIEISATIFIIILFLRINQHSEKEIPAKNSLFAKCGGTNYPISRKMLLLVLAFFFFNASFFITIHFFYYGFIFLNLELTPYLATAPIHLAYLIESDPPLTIIIEGISIVLVAPVVEEIFYRGLMLRASEDAKWSRISIYVFQFITFGIIHVDPSSALIYQLIRFTQTGFIAVVCMWLYRSTRNIIFPIIAHFLWNLQSMIIDLTVVSGYFEQTETYFFVISFISLIACGGYLLLWFIRGNYKKYRIGIPKPLNRAELRLFLLCTGIFVLNRLFLMYVLTYQDSASADSVSTFLSFIFTLVFVLEIFLMLYLVVYGPRLHNVPYNEIASLNRYWNAPIHSFTESDCENYNIPAEVQNWLNEDYQVFQSDEPQEGGKSGIKSPE